MMNKTQSTRRNTGFTLIELMVVIAIIGILAAILFPVFTRARENAIRSSCQSNLKQVGLSFFQYMQDFDSRMPAGKPFNGTGAVGVGWLGPIYPYAKSTGVFACPNQLNSGDPANGIFPNSYGMNSNLKGIKDTRLRKAEKTVLCFEGDFNGVRMQDPNEADSMAGEMAAGRCCLSNPEPVTLIGSNGIGNPGGGSQPSVMTGTPDYYKPTHYGFWNADPMHLNGSNFLMADGHVKYYQPEQVGFGMPSNTAGGDVQGGYFANTAGNCSGYYCMASGLDSDARQVTFTY